MKTVWTVLFFVLMVGTATADDSCIICKKIPCGDRVLLQRELKTIRKQTLYAYRKWDNMMMEIYMSPMGDYSMVSTLPSGFSCLLKRGHFARFKLEI